ncbi:MAG: VOC family protein [Streptosporangiaceae bacterium]
MASPLNDWMEMPVPSSLAWLSLGDDRGSLGELALDHVGLAVYDVDAAMERFGTRLGLHDWVLSTFSIASTYRGTEQIIGGRVATAAMGPINLELVQPTQGSWTPVEFLEGRGEGLYHLGFRVPDLTVVTQRAEDAGIELELLATHATTPVFTYTDNSDLFGVTVELVGPRVPTQMITSAEVVH